MAQLNNDLLDMLENVSKAWSLPLTQKLIENVRRKKLTTTKQLLNSLDSKTYKDVGKAVIGINFVFENYGRFWDMRRNIWHEQPPVDELIAWVEKKGVRSFGPDPRPYKKKDKPDHRRANEIAWGIARSRAKKQSSKK